MAQTLNQINYPVLLRFGHAGMHRNADTRLEVVFCMRAIARLEPKARIVGLPIDGYVVQVHLHASIGQCHVQRLLADA